MTELAFWLFLAMFYLSIFFIDTIFRSCMFFPYIKFLNDTGICIKPFMISWENSSFNQLIWHWGRFKPRFLRKWFQIGSYVVSCLMIPSMVLLTFPLFWSLSSRDNKERLLDKPALVPIIPGYNIPCSQIPYYVTTLFICVAVHEFGHALAASREMVMTEGWGFSLCAVFPMAYVRLPFEHLKNLSLPQQLRIYAAGIWHNIALAALALLLTGANPSILQLFYQSGNGITILNVAQGSTLSKAGGLKENDHVIAVNSCPVINLDSWQICLKSAKVEQQSGFCSTSLFIEEHDVSKHDGSCCKNSSEHMCFKFYKNEVYEEACLPVRKLAEEPMCKSNGDCSELCVVPVFESTTEKIINIKRMSGLPVLFIGTVEEIHASVFVSPWVARFMSPQYADMYETFLAYIIMFSLGIAFINVLPWFWLDGQHLVECVVNHYLADIVRDYRRRSLIIFYFKIAGCIAFLTTGYASVKEIIKNH